MKKVWFDTLYRWLKKSKELKLKESRKDEKIADKRKTNNRLFSK